ncbi:hypothetical protein PIB30_045360 [Stylosanthes scabra]|uniref:Uncharacterized protein n=1 Tax=Stylosanthes scabra TaxID=79078 RepID=A0ABU6RGT8_9FABA|nr:hypothetical protein [Stylosanthes scabra]
MTDCMEKMEEQEINGPDELTVNSFHNYVAKQSKAPRICVEDHAYACCSYPNPRLSMLAALRRGNTLDPSHAYA